MTNIKSRYLLGIFLLFFALNLKAGYFSQVLNKAQDITKYFKRTSAKKAKNEKIIDEFENIDVSDDKHYADNKSKFEGLNIDHFQLEPGQFHTMSQADLKERFGFLAVKVDKSNIGVRACHRFIPENCNITKKPIVITVVHGTFVPESAEYYSIYSDFYHSVSEFAKNEATKNHAPVEIISLQWSGRNSGPDRQNAGLVLADVLNKFYNHYDIYTIAHSHGCNVVNSASRFLHENLFIKHAIHLACPVRDLSEEQFNPKQFEKLTQFYSNDDMIAALGSLTQYNWFFGSGNCRKFASQNHKAITNVRVLLNGCDVGHSNAKNDIARYLNQILDNLDNYSINQDLTLNIDKRNANPILVAIRNPVKELPKTANSNDAEFSLEKAMLELELQHSKSQNDVFNQIYKKDMNRKSYAIYRFLNGLYQEIAG